MALAFKRMQAKRHTANTQHQLSQCHIYTEHTGILALSHSQIEKSGRSIPTPTPLICFLYIRLISSCAPVQMRGCRPLCQLLQ